MSLSKEKVKEVLDTIDRKWKEANAGGVRVSLARSEWILKHCEWELRKLCNMHITPQWLNENGYDARVALKKALTNYEPELWEQRWHRREEA
jgi:hypothetical protein